MKAKPSLQLITIVLVALAVAIGCSKAPNDAQITSDVQSKLTADSGLQNQGITVQTADGTVTLSGTVDNENERDAAARYASSAKGVKQVVNNLTVASAAMTPPAPEQPAEAAPMKSSPSKPRHHSTSSAPAESSSSSSSSSSTMASPAPATDAMNAAPATPPPPQKVTIPSGTTLAIRLVDTIDSETATQGQTFRATLDSPLSVDGDIVIPAGYDVEGHVVDVKSAGKFAGQSELKLQLDRLGVGTKSYSIQTDQFSRQGSSRGKNTAAKVGGGAAIGAIIGAIAGGGKGAAIGAAAGGGLGTGVQAATKGQQIKLPSETVLNFTLQAPVSVLPAPSRNAGRQPVQ